MNIELAKQNFPKSNLFRWTLSALHCYERNCVCENCIYKEAIKSTKCQMKACVLLLIEKFGKPNKSQIEYYFKQKEIYDKNHTIKN